MNSHPWQQVELELLDPPSPKQRPVRATARVLVPSAAARFGIISDIDDTVISSHVINKLKMILTVILANEHTRQPFAGVAALYRALQGGASGGENTSDLLVFEQTRGTFTPYLLEFLNVQKIPLGPLLLRDFGDHLLFAEDPRATEAQHQNDFGSFPHLSFVLIATAASATRKFTGTY